jgi:hypothetical protein
MNTCPILALYFQPSSFVVSHHPKLFVHSFELPSHDSILINSDSGENEGKGSNTPIRKTTFFNQISPKTHIPSWSLLPCGIGCSLCGGFCLLLSQFFFLHEKKAISGLFCPLLGAVFFSLVFAFSQWSYEELTQIAIVPPVFVFYLELK